MSSYGKGATMMLILFLSKIKSFILKQLLLIINFLEIKSIMDPELLLMTSE